VPGRGRTHHPAQWVRAHTGIDRCSEADGSLSPAFPLRPEHEYASSFAERVRQRRAVWDVILDDRQPSGRGLARSDAEVWSATVPGRQSSLGMTLTGASCPAYDAMPTLGRSVSVREWPIGRMGRPARETPNVQAVRDIRPRGSCHRGIGLGEPRSRKSCTTKTTSPVCESVTGHHIIQCTLGSPRRQMACELPLPLRSQEGRYRLLGARRLALEILKDPLVLPNEARGRARRVVARQP
jgi:hypothetical protein